ncbi:MAG: hypothetical protein QOH66_343 [Actinomycetota bacterium]|nr:hypothetical protein [Actinomycetota bacterium]
MAERVLLTAGQRGNLGWQAGEAVARVWSTSGICSALHIGTGACQEQQRTDLGGPGRRGAWRVRARAA